MIANWQLGALTTRIAVPSAQDHCAKQLECRLGYKMQTQTQINTIILQIDPNENIAGQWFLVPKEIRHFLFDLARRRMELHANHESSRPLSKHYEYIGLMGEWLFGQVFDLEMDLSLKPAGDGRVDFWCNGFSIDVKSGNMNTFNLFREIEKDHAEILVLAETNISRGLVRLHGWEFDEEMLKCLTKKFGHPIVNHYKPKGNLKSIQALKEFLGKY